MSEATDCASKRCARAVRFFAEDHIEGTSLIAGLLDERDYVTFENVTYEHLRSLFNKFETGERMATKKRDNTRNGKAMTQDSDPLLFIGEQINERAVTCSKDFALALVQKFDSCVDCVAKEFCEKHEIVEGVAHIIAQTVKTEFIADAKAGLESLLVELLCQHYRQLVNTKLKSFLFVE